MSREPVVSSTDSVTLVSLELPLWNVKSVPVQKKSVYNI